MCEGGEGVGVGGVVGARMLLDGLGSHCGCGELLRGKADRYRSSVEVKNARGINRGMMSKE